MSPITKLMGRVRRAEAERDRALARIAEAAKLHRHGWQEIAAGNGMNGEVIYRKVAWCLRCDEQSPCADAVALGLGEACDVAPGGRACENPKLGHKLHYSNGEARGE